MVQHSAGGNNCAIKKNERMRIGTWNVRTLLRVGKLENLKREMEVNRMDIVGLSEVRWEGEGEISSGEFKLFYSGKHQGQNGVGFIVSKKVDKSIKKVVYEGDRIIGLKLGTRVKDILVMQVYMPTSEYEDEEIEEMYERIEDILDREGKGCIKIIMGDWNAEVGRGKEGNTVGPFGYGHRNERGDRLVEFCKERNLLVGNTWFENQKRRLYTWKSPGDRYRKQIDYILVEERFRNGVRRVCTLPGADINSDHNLLMSEVNFRLKKVHKGNMKKRWNLEKLKEKREIVREKLVERIKKEEFKNVEQQWQNFSESIKEVAKEEIGFEEGRRIKKPWVTKEMLEKMNERRKFKGRSDEEGKKRYRKLNNELRRETEKAREKWLEEECQEIEELERRGRTDLMYRKVKQATWDKKRTARRNCELEGEDGEMILQEKGIVNRWKEYIEDLYSTKRNMNEEMIEQECEVNEEDLGPKILKEEVRLAMKEMKNGKAVGIDEIPIELLRCMGEEGLEEIVKLCNSIYIRGEWPKDFVKTVMIPIPKKQGTRKCQEYRTISLISHAAKIMLRVLNRRLVKKMEESMGEEQYGFRRGRGTRDAIGVVKTIGERYIERGKAVNMCFIDLEKAFDRVNWRKLMEILKVKRVDWRDRRLIEKLYREQEVTVKVGSTQTEWIRLGRGVRQGCCMSPTLFNMYEEEMINEFIGKEGSSIGGRRISCVRFADDMVLFEESKGKMQRMIDRLQEKCNEYEMKINVRKTKVMRIGDDERINLKANGENIEQVNEFRYLGVRLTGRWNSETEIKTRIGMAKEAFNRKRRILSGKLDRTLRKRLAKCFVWSVLLYGAEAWTMRKRERDRLEAFEMWVWRRMEKIKWTDKVSNAKVLRRVDEERKLLKVIKERKRRWLGHVMRGENLLKAVIEGTVEGRNKRGRKRMKMTDDLERGEYAYVKRKAQDRKGWREGKE